MKTTKRQKNSEVVYVRFPKALRELLRAASIKENISEAEVVRRAVQALLK